MIKLKLIRQNPLFKSQDFTHGNLLIKMSNSNVYKDFAYTLEDPVRDIDKDGSLDEEKVYGKTAIPFGIYKGFLRFSPSKNRVVPELKDVPNFKYIQIHSGNTAKDTQGCILIGYKTDNNGSIWQSYQAERDLVNILENNNKEFEIEII